MASSSNQNPTKKITLRSSDDHLFDVEENIAMEFVVLKGFLEDSSEADEAIIVPLPNVSAAVLSRMITYIKKHLELTGNSTPKEKVKAMNDEFAKDQTNDMLRELILAANYLDVKYFLDFLAEELANRIQNKSVEYVRNFFGVENDYTPEEEAEIRREYAWAFEGVDRD